nr:dienelactone hydrolase family protein [Candidatus Sigynarchaeota archaeon]
MSPRAAVMSIPYKALSGDDWFLEAEFIPGEDCCDELAIICHPHPLFGGEMHNYVVDTLYTGLSAARCTTRFNFSSVGGSDGVHEGGTGEVGQVSAVINYMAGAFTSECCAGKPWTAIHVIGYSFGAAMALPAALSSSASTCTCIAFPFEMFAEQAKDSLAKFRQRSIPLFFVMGEMDNFTPLRVFKQWVSKFDSAKQTIIAGADHFFDGYERQIVAETQKFLNAVKPDPSDRP